jgi:hypothetical protein
VEGQNCEWTNANGEYTIPNLPFGNYRIEFWPRAYVQWVFEYYDDTRHWSQAQWIDVNGPVTGIDSDLTVAGEFIGTVTRASDGEPLSEVLICAEEPLQEFTECTESGIQGFYQLANLIEGDFLVEFLPAEGQGVRAQFYNGKSESSEADLVHVTTGAQTNEIHAALSAEATITGLVTDASTRSGLGEIEVCAFELAGSEITGCEFTEPSGSYVITDLPTGAYKVGFFSESEEEEELLGSSPFPVEFWNDQPSWETANILTLGLGVRGSVDAALGSPPSTPVTAQASTFPSSTFASVPKPKTRRARCRSGKRWKKVKGKKRCVKVHKRAHRKRPHRQ